MVAGLVAVAVLLGSGLVTGSVEAGATELRKASVHKANSKCKKSQRGKISRDKKKRKLVCKKVGKKKYRWKIKSPKRVAVKYRYADASPSCRNSMRLEAIGKDNVVRVERVLRYAPGNSQISPVSYRSGRLLYEVYNCSSGTTQFFIMRSLTDSSPLAVTAPMSNFPNAALSPDGRHVLLATEGTSSYTVTDYDWISRVSTPYTTFSNSGRSVSGLAAGTGDVVYVYFKSFAGPLSIQAFDRGWSTGTTVLTNPGGGSTAGGFASNSWEALALTNESHLSVRLPFNYSNDLRSVPACSAGYSTYGPYVAWVDTAVALVTCGVDIFWKRLELVSFSNSSVTRTALHGGYGIRPIGLS